MPLKSYQLTTSAVPKRVSDVFGDGAGVVDAADDLPFRQVLLQAQTADVFIGENNAISTTVYGTLIPVTGSPVITLGPFETGPIKLSNLWAVGTTGVLHITGIPF